MRISRSWAADALPHLWHHATDSALAAYASYGVFNYAALVRELTVFARFPSAEVLRHWPFLPYLQRLKIEAKAVWEVIVDEDDFDGRGNFAFLWRVCCSALSPLHVETGSVLYAVRWWLGRWDLG